MSNLEEASSPVTVLIRRARPEEAAALTDLSMRSKQSNGYDQAFMDACRGELTVTPARMEVSEYWVAEADVICGCACLSPGADGRSAEVGAFFIDPAWRRRGVGRKLWKQLVERAKSQGIAVLELDADPFAVPFYQAMGFLIVGETPSGSIPGRFLPRMALNLGIDG
jgi:GNAT superfamily N-acetyltransferase